MLREHQLLAGRSSSHKDPPAPFLCCQEPRGCPRTGGGGVGKGTALASTSRGLEGSLHDLPELLNDVFVEPVGQR
jgi:hypothetical protein